MGMERCCRDADSGRLTCHFTGIRANDQPKTPMGLCVFKHSIAIILLITVAVSISLTRTHEKSADLSFARIGGWCCLDAFPGEAELAALRGWYAGLVIAKIRGPLPGCAQGFGTVVTGNDWSKSAVN
jgi:hypothetical protein